MNSWDTEPKGGLHMGIPIEIGKIRPQRMSGGGGVGTPGIYRHPEDSGTSDGEELY